MTPNFTSSVNHLCQQGKIVAKVFKGTHKTGVGGYLFQLLKIFCKKKATPIFTLSMPFVRGDSNTPFVDVCYSLAAAGNKRATRPPLPLLGHGREWKETGRNWWVRIGAV